LKLVRLIPAEIIPILRKRDVHYRVRDRTPHAPIMRQTNPAHGEPGQPLIIHVSVKLPYTLMSSEWSLIFRFCTKTLCAFFVSLALATFSAHIVKLDFITPLIIFGKENTSRSSSACNFHQLPVNFSI